MYSISIATPDDFHRHLRRGPLLEALMRHLGGFRRATVMPNATGDIKDANDVRAYREEILYFAHLAHVQDFEPIMTVKLTPDTTPQMIIEAGKAGAKAAKFYPKGMTTGADNGIPADEFAEMNDLFSALVEANMLLLLHGEHDQSVDCLDREKDFLKIVALIVKKFPKLRIVLEHITTEDAAQFVKQAPATVAATITPHHLRITLNDVIGDKLRPHNFCKPVAKRVGDQYALIRAATSGNRKFFGGTDCAAHLKGSKECAEGCAGVFTGEWGILHYADVFEEAGRLVHLEHFLSRFGAFFYDLPYYNEGRLELKRERTIIPQETDGIVPFMAGRSLNWSYA